MSYRTIDYDPVTKKSIVAHKHDGKTTIETSQNVDAIIDHNTFRAKHEEKGDRWYVGSVDLVTCLKWADESGTKLWSKAWNDYAIKQLNLSEYRKYNQNKIKL